VMARVSVGGLEGACDIQVFTGMHHTLRRSMVYSHRNGTERGNGKAIHSLPFISRTLALDMEMEAGVVCWHGLLDRGDSYIS